MNELALFAGGGGGILGGLLNGWRTRCAVEIDAYCRRSLLARQRDGSLHPFPIWDDVCTFDGRPWRGSIDIVTGGFPCQDISSAGKGAGITGERSGLWKEFARIIREVGPSYVLVENSPVLTSRGLGVVLGDLATLGYDARWGVLGADDAIWSLGDPCADHERDRIWILATLANASGGRCGEQGAGEVQQQRRAQTERPGAAVLNANGTGRAWSGSSQSKEWNDDSLTLGASEVQQIQDAKCDGWQQVEPPISRGTAGEGAASAPASPVASWWNTERGLDRVAHGVANRVDRLEAIGNGQVPAVVRLAWNILRQP